MTSTDGDEQKPSEDDLRRVVEDLKKKDAETLDRGDMPADSSLGRPSEEKGAPEECLPPDDEEN